jgi:glycosyltransferase involved in cell wall biosynthesis
MPFPIAYFAAVFPNRSETFVYREVRELRRRGWDVRPVSLNDPKEPGLAEFADLEKGNTIVYGAGAGATLLSMLAEGFLHPIRSIRTNFTALLDAIAPGESMSVKNRLKTIVQGLAGIGVARKLRAADVKHIHCHFAHAPSSVGMYAAMQLGVPFSFTGHANDLFQRRSLLSKKLKRASFVACISEWHRCFYESAGADLAKCHVIRCGVPVNEWTPRDPGHTRKPIEVLTVCRLVEKKGVDTLLRGLHDFSARSRGAFHLTIAGDGEESGKLKALADELKIRASCEFLGAVSNDRVRELLSNADYFALPCREDSRGDRDGIPVVLMEAMACGVPVISGDLPAIRELITHGESGMLVDGTRPEDVPKALMQLEDDEQLRARVASGARARVEKEFSLEENVTRLEKLFVGWATPTSSKTVGSAHPT